MLHQCPCGGIVRCNGWFDGNGRDLCDSSARAIPQSPNFATDLATTDSLTFPHRQPRARIAANGAQGAVSSPASVANTPSPVSLRGTFQKAATVRRTICRSAAGGEAARPLQRLVRRRSDAIHGGAPSPFDTELSSSLK
jgi:hypothetical protein